MSLLKTESSNTYPASLGSPRNSDAMLGCTLLRITLGINIAGHGISRILAGPYPYGSRDKGCARSWRAVNCCPYLREHAASRLGNRWTPTDLCHGLLRPPCVWSI